MRKTKAPKRKHNAPRATSARSKSRINVQECPSAWWAEQLRAGNGRTKFPPPADHAPMVRCDCGGTRCNGTFFPNYYGAPPGSGRSINGVCVDGWSDDCIEERFELYRRRLAAEGILEARDPYPKARRRNPEDSGEGEVLMQRLSGGAPAGRVRYQVVLPDESIESLGMEIMRWLADGNVHILYEKEREAVVLHDADGQAYEELLAQGHESKRALEEWG